MSITRSLRRAALCRRGPSLRRWVSSPGQAPEPQEPAAAPAEEVVWYALWRSEKGKRMLRWACMLYVAVLAAAWYMSAAYEAAVQVLKDEKKAQPDPTAALRLGGHMQLTDHNGAPFNTEEQLRGKWWLVYFGFANCATVCPAELTKITDALNELDADPSLPQVTPLFVTLDPDRDTPQAVKKFVEPYHKRFVGLTGSTEEIKEAAKKFRVYFSVVCWVLSNTLKSRPKPFSAQFHPYEHIVLTVSFNSFKVTEHERLRFIL